MKTQQAEESLENQVDQVDKSSKTHGEPLYLNVYHFNTCFNRWCECLGLGVYHTGVEFYDEEYMYFGFEGDETGVGYLQPKTAAYEFKEQVLLGYTEQSIFQIDRNVLDPLRLEFIGNKYDLLAFNCNHFSKRAMELLQVQTPIPDNIFRITDFFNRCRCCIPNCILNGRLDWFKFGKEEDYESVEEKQHVTFKDQHETS